MATWSPVTGYRKFNFSDVNNLRGRILRIAVSEQPPFLVRNQTAFDLSNGNVTVMLYQGIIPNMIRTLSVVLNFRYELVFCKPGDQYYGTVDKNGKWNGMIGMLQRGEVDLIAADLTVSLQRQSVVEFTVPFYEDPMTILLPRSQFNKHLFGFLFPFSTSVWFCVIAAVGASGPLLYVFSRATPYYAAQKKVNYFASLSEAYIYCYGSIVSQG
ncbi:hypothetical protein RvY_06270-2 [Ramazzottius varieornatus]|uniref:Ionotropic glutamate receptor L-glutamate and glycine-binding domain-containing protein n=1 Tax=Ramazzottius varieornatus TaxID=947166 RepID=A0A1D1V7M9_RAMVA|nr:hypothetical protein RvY_06270-2 [Ramazzottius varieornatus]